MRPMAVSDRILRANCCRERTVSATMSKRPASDPPTWRWIVTAVIANSKFFEPTRSAMSASASSIGRPRDVSVRTRFSSWSAGGWPSSTTACRPCLNECPAFSEAADALAHLEPDERERHRPGDGHHAEHERRREAEQDGEEEHDDHRHDLDPEELDRLDRHVGALEHAPDPPPLFQVAEHVLGRPEDIAEHLESPFLARLLRADLRLADMDRDPAAHPGAAQSPQREE